MSAEADRLHAAVHDRIAALLADRQWYRTHRWADWPDIRRENEVELRALLRLAREARRSPTADSMVGWSEPEKAAAWGR